MSRRAASSPPWAGCTPTSRQGSRAGGPHPQGPWVVFTEPLPLVCGRREVPGPGPKTRGEAGPRGLQGGPQGDPPTRRPPQVRADGEETPPAVTCRHSPFRTVTPGGTGPAAPSSQFSGRGSRGVVWTPRGWRESGLRVQGGAPWRLNARCGGRGALPLVMGQALPRRGEAASSGKSGSGPRGSPSPRALQPDPMCLPPPPLSPVPPEAQSWARLGLGTPIACLPQAEAGPRSSGEGPVRQGPCPPSAAPPLGEMDG